MGSVDPLLKHNETGSDLIDNYVEYATEVCDAPKIYHLAMGYFVVSSILGRAVRLVTPFARKGIAPNIWVLLMGPSRITRKSTAMRLGVEIIEAVAPQILIPASFTPEALYEMFNQLNPGDTVVWVKDELGGFFKSLEKRYMAGLRELLSSLYMGFGEVRKLRNVTLKIPEGLYVTAVGTAPTPPSEYLHEEDFQSGFMNRWIIVYAERRERRLPLLRQSPRADEKFEEIVAKLKRHERALLSTPTVLSPTGAAIDKIDEYDREVDREIERIERQAPRSLFKSYLAEMPMTLLKLSILRRLARGDYGRDGLITIEREDVDRALGDLKAFIESARNVIDDVQSSPRPKPVLTEEKAIERVFNYISSKGEEGPLTWSYWLNWGF